MADSDDRSILPREGERSLLIGQTGSGKTGLELWLVRRVDQSPVIIYDTKNEPKFRALPDAAFVGSWDSVQDALEQQANHYVVFTPPVADMGDPAALDDYLMQHYETFDGVPALIDEIYSFHIGYRAGPGLTAMLTRGRSQGITCIMGTQRPAFISGFVYSEAQAFYLMYLATAKDRKRIADFVPDFDKLSQVPHGSHQFYFYRLGDTEARLMPAVELDAGVDTGYTIGTKSQRSDEAGQVAPLKERHNWL